MQQINTKNRFKEPSFWLPVETVSVSSDAYACVAGGKKYSLMMATDVISLPSAYDAEVPDIGLYLHVIALTCADRLCAGKTLIGGAKEIRKVLGANADGMNPVVWQRGILIEGDPAPVHDVAAMQASGIIIQYEASLLDYAVRTEHIQGGLMFAIHKIYERVTGFKDYAAFLKSGYMTLAP